MTLPGRLAGRRTVLLLVVALLLGATLALTWHRVEQRSCGAGVEAVRSPSEPLMTAGLMRERPDRHRDRLAAAVERMGPPFGPVVAGVDYYYEQWLHLYGVAGGVLAWTKRNAPVTLLSGEDLRPVWALRPDTRRVAWDASADTFLLLTLSADRPTQVLAYDLASGDRRWCAALSTSNAEGDPVTTGFLADGSVVVASRAQGSRAASVVRLSPDGGQQWATRAAEVDRADFVGGFGDLVVVGGREEYRLADRRTPAPRRPLTAFAADTGTPVWRYDADGAAVHVVGVSGDLLVVLESRPGGARLLGLDARGHEAWGADLPATALQTTLRDGVVLVKSADALEARAATDGRRLWRHRIPPTFTPYGFTLAMMPSLDADHVLVPTTRELRSLDVHTGAQRHYRLPVDGINTTYWPYQLLATDHLLGIVTNTGAVVARRTP